MDKENRFTWKVRIATLSIFLLGFVAGALALNAYHVWLSPAASVSKQQRFDRIFDQIQLSDSQKTDVQKIMSDTREEFKNLPPDPRVQVIRDRADEKFKKIFTPEQWNKFQSLREEFRQSEKDKSK